MQRAGSIDVRRRKAFLGLLAMHHIYCPTKRQCIVELAELRALSGLYLFGKPGRVVVEGERVAVRDYIESVRAMRWQKCAEMAPLMESAVWLQGQRSQLFPEQHGFIEVASEDALSRALSDWGAASVDRALKRPFGGARIALTSEAEDTRR